MRRLDDLNFATDCSCTVLQNCSALDGPCGAGECDPATGMCGYLQPAPPGTSCGGGGSDCDKADICDGEGFCRTGVEADGVPCTDCGGSSCDVCIGGTTCQQCMANQENDFDYGSRIAGWDMTPGWGLYTHPAASDTGPNTAFPTQALGTDGNRSLPYPGGEEETSYARTPPTLIPPTLQFWSWNVDEGGGNYDNKRISVSTDGGQSWTPLADCDVYGLDGYAFCNGTSPVRDPALWDIIQISTGALAGQMGIVEFYYATGDSCCSEEQGWYIDDINFAPPCP